MKQTGKLQNRLKGLTDAISRFPLTALFLIVATVVNAIDINTDHGDYSKYLLALVVGAFLGAIVQVVYERYFYKVSARILLIGLAIFLSLGYYLIIMPIPKLTMEIGIRTSIALFAILIGFIWVPSIKSRLSFNESFMVAFKAFFIALFFSGVIFAGVSIIIAAIDQLLFDVNYRSYSHTSNIVFIMFAPMYFLSLIPIYLGKKDHVRDKESLEQQEDIINKRADCPKYLEILISYIIIPLTAVFTLILLLYIILNIGEDFWTNNLLEPMTVSYSITVILVYILSSRLENKFASVFRSIFPKVLIPIVLFQTISSSIMTGNMGITHTRYLVILYGIFATLAGIIFSILPVRKNGIIGALLICFSMISIVPPVDAFTISRGSQIDILENVLARNNMLEDNQIKPNTSISDDDKQKIIKSVNYLSMMEYTDKISWLPADFNYYNDFNKTFGFNQYDDQPENNYVYLRLPQNSLINISGFDFFVNTDVFTSDRDPIDKTIGVFEKSGKKFTLKSTMPQGQSNLVLVNEEDQELIKFSVKEVFEKFDNASSIKGEISVEEATFSNENDFAALTIVIQNLNIDKTPDRVTYGADLFILVKLK